MRRIGIPAAGALFLLNAVRAAADGGPVPERYGLPGYEPRDWSGFYGGVQGGWLWGEFEFREVGGRFSVEEIEPGPRFPTAFELTDHGGSFVVGGVLGINQQDEGWVYGGEIDIQFTDISGEVISPSGNRLSSELNVFGSVRGRLGYSLDRALPYVTAGVAVGGTDLEASTSGPLPDRISSSQTVFGFTVGAGVEFALGERWSAGIEYRYTDLSETFSEDEFTDSNFQFEGSNRFSTVQARLIWRFGE